MRIKAFIKEVWEDSTLRAELVRVAFLVLLACLCIVACEKGARGPSAPQIAAVKSAAASIASGSKNIDEHAAAIDKQAPQVRPETDGIRGETGKLRVLQGQLDAAAEQLKANDIAFAAATAELEGKVGALEKQVGGLQDDLTKAQGEMEVLANRRLAGLIATAVIVTGVGFGLCFWIGRWGLAVVATGIGIGVSAIAFKQLMDYALWVMLGALGLGAVLLLTHTKVIRDVTTFSERIKNTTDREEIKRIGDEVQGWWTRNVVKRVRQRFGLDVPQAT